MSLLKKRLPVLDEDRVRTVSDWLNLAITDAPDFWSVAGPTELRLLAALATAQLAVALPGVLASLRDLKTRVPSALMWDSVYDGAKFTLLPYVQMAGAKEKRAAQSLLDELKVMASDSTGWRATAPAR